MRRLLLLVLTAVLGLGGTRGADQESGTELFLYTLWDPAALCNDGSQAGYYFAPATEPTKSNLWLVYLQGGQWCYDAA